MDLRQLRSLVAVSEERTFVQASKRLHLTQPALSRQIRTFEREVGTAVFHRGRGGVTLTPAGEVCLRAARSIIDKVEKAADEARLASAGKAGTCTIYASQWCVWSGFTGRLLSHLAKYDPGIDVIIKEGEVGDRWHCLRHGHVDIAIATAPRSGFEDLHCETLLDDVASMALLSPRHPLASRQSIRLEELADATLLVYDQRIVDNIDWDVVAELKRAGFIPKRTHHLETSESLLARVSAGLGWSIHRKSLKGKIPDIATVPIENFSVPLPISLMHRVNESQPHILEVARRIREAASAAHPSMRTSGIFDVPVEPQSRETTKYGDLEIRDLRYFAAVVEERGIGRAAVRLGLTQPALSRQIRSMEQAVGVSLVARATRGIIPTIAGKSLYSAAREILGDVSRLPAEVERGQRDAAGRCIIATVASPIARDMLSAVLRNAEERYAHLEISVHHVASPDQAAAVNEGEFDVGLCHPFFNLTSGFPDIDCRELLTDWIDGALLPADHPLAASDSITVDDLASIPFLCFRRDFRPAFYDYLMESFRRLGYSPVVGPTQNGLDTLWSMCEQGAGWSLAFASHRRNPPPGLVAIRIEGFRIPWGVNIISRKNEARPGARAVIDLLFEESARRNAVPEYSPQRRLEPAFAGT
ncbi:MAG TPA: LysR family transcriptional regulator [Gemmatimonadaceae bacterium]